MIKEVIVTNYIGESIVLNLANPWTNGLAITKIDGLGPPKADINSTNFATMDGAQFNSARATTRNVVIYLTFRDDPSKPIIKNVETVRQLTYKYFPIKKPVTLMFTTDNRICTTVGYVESNEPDIFAKEETSQISILCPDPYLYSVEVQNTVFSSIESMFEFPFSNESLTEPLLEFGVIQNKTEQTVYYDGDVEVGIVILIHALGTATNISIYNVDTREQLKIDTTKLAAIPGLSGGIVAGDDIIISTIKGSKSMQLLRNGIYTNILNALDQQSDWFSLSKGDNVFAYTADTGASNLQFQIANQIAYEGV